MESEALDNKLPVAVQKDMHRLLLGFQAQTAAALPGGGDTKISDIRAGFHGQRIAENAGGLNYKRSFVSYTPVTRLHKSGQETAKAIGNPRQRF